MKVFGAMARAANVSNKGWVEVGWFTLLTAVGAGLTYAIPHMSEVDFGKWGPFMMAVAVPFLTYLKNKVQELMKQPPPGELDFCLICPNRTKK